MKNQIQLFEEKKVRTAWDEESEFVTNCNQLKMQSADGKYYKTDVVST